ncbi:antitoxin [Aeromicrobium sp. UC242_57]|uniref:antitoxin n=1 Tax=Aeromicrobium sp. UC242_57 TaxID=3374624 RepID=UPI0037AAF781
MGFLDKLKKKAPELKEKAADLAASQNDKIDKGIDKAADLANKATKGKYDEKIDGAAGKAKEGVDKFAQSDDNPDKPA